MTKVFISGSRKITGLSESVKARLENIIKHDLTVLVGDANGADKKVQQYLAARNYLNVLVYCSGDVCRNNVGNWKTINVLVKSGSKGFDLYVAKDEQMAQAADYGLALWDAKSNGTLNNVLNLLSANKKVLVYLEPDDSLHTIKNAADLLALLTECERTDLKRFEEKLKLSQRLREMQDDSLRAAS